jgi:hypothetical protein
MVSSGPKLLLMVMSPSAAIACVSDRHDAAINVRILINAKSLMINRSLLAE